MLDPIPTISAIAFARYSELNPKLLAQMRDVRAMSAGAAGPVLLSVAAALRGEAIKLLSREKHLGAAVRRLDFSGPLTRAEVLARLEDIATALAAFKARYYFVYPIAKDTMGEWMHDGSTIA